MVYAGTIEGEKVSLGVSGRLKDRNLIMWDSETDSLWSQIKGEALHGKRKGEKLDLVPAVFVGLGTWSRMHPKTKVLDLSKVRAEPWQYTTEDLARAEVNGRGGKQKLGLGLRHADDTLFVPLAAMHERGVVHCEVGGIPLDAVWVADESAPLVYRSDEPLALDGDELHRGAHRWDALTGAALSDDTPALVRFAYLPSYRGAWRTYYPQGRELEPK